MRGLVLAAVAAVGTMGAVQEAGAKVLPFDGKLVFHSTGVLEKREGDDYIIHAIGALSLSFAGDTVFLDFFSQTSPGKSIHIKDSAKIDESDNIRLAEKGSEYGFSEEGDIVYNAVYEASGQRYGIFSETFGTQEDIINTTLPYYQTYGVAYLAMGFDIGGGFTVYSYSGNDPAPPYARFDMEYFPPATVPLPAAAPMLLIGAAGLFALKRKRRS